MHRVWPIAIAILAYLAPAIAPAAEPLPRSVLVLDQSIPYNTWFTELMAAFQSGLNAGPGTPITVYSEKLEYSHFKGADYEKLLQVFINEKYRDKPIGVIVAVGQDALRFAEGLRTHRPAIPIIFAVVDQGDGVSPRPDRECDRNNGQAVAARGARRRESARSEHQRGSQSSAILWQIRTYRRHYQQELAVFAGDLEHIDLTGMAMADLRKRVATLPERFRDHLYDAVHRWRGRAVRSQRRLRTGCRSGQSADRDRSGNPPGSRRHWRLRPSAPHRSGVKRLELRFAC